MESDTRSATFWPLAALVLTAIFVGLNPPLASAVHRLIPLVSALVFVAAFAGWGAVPAQALSDREDSRTDRILLSCLLGAGLTGAAVFLLGILGIVDPTLFALWILTGLGLLAWKARSVFGADDMGNRGVEPGALAILSIVAITVNVLLVLPMLLSPVVSTDAMEYHLMIPKIVLAAGRIAPLPSLMESNYPELMSWLYLPVTALAGDIACKALHFLAGIGVLFAIARLADRVRPGSTPAAAPAFFLSMPVAAVLFGWAWNDLLFTLCILVALGQLLDFNDDPSREHSVRRLIAAGILLGLAAWTKYTIVMTLTALAPVLLLALRNHRWKIRHLAVLATPVVLISLPVFIKNAAFTGNPFYPFLHTIFPSPTWSDTTAAYFHNALQNWEIPRWHWHSPVTVPFHTVFTPRLIDIHTGLLPLLAAPFVFVRTTDPARRFLKLFLLFHVLAWAFFRTETRSLLVFLAVLFAVAVPELERRIFDSARLRRAGTAAIAAALTASLGITAITTLILTEPLKYLFGLESTRSFLTREVRHFEPLEWLNGRPYVRGAVLVGFKRPYYAEKPIWFSAFSDIPIAEVLTGTEGTADDLVRKLRTLGATHIAIDRDEWEADHRDGLYSWPPERRRVFEDLLEKRCRPVARFGATTIYELGAPSPLADRHPGSVVGGDADENT